MTDTDWANALEIFRASLPRRERPGRPAVPGGAALFLSPQHHLASSAGALRQMKQRVEAVRPAEQSRRLRDLLRPPRRAQFVSASGADVRQHCRPRPCLGGRCKRGQKDQALGRLRSGFSTKIHLKTHFDGHPIAFDLTGGECESARQSDHGSHNGINYIKCRSASGPRAD
jgi:hypothetical protein